CTAGAARVTHHPPPARGLFSPPAAGGGFFSANAGTGRRTGCRHSLRHGFHALLARPVAASGPCGSAVPGGPGANPARDACARPPARAAAETAFSRSAGRPSLLVAAT